MGDIDGDGEGLDSGTRTRVRVGFLASCMVSIGIWLESGSRFNVRVRVILRFWVTVKYR